MWSQGFNNGQSGQLLVTSVAMAIINRGRRRPRMRYYRFLIVLVAVQLFVGVTLAAVSIYASTVTTSLRLRDLPHWAGIPLSLSGFLGMIYITRCYGDLRVNNVTNFFKVLSATLAAFTLILCVCAVVFLALHLATFSNFEECKDVPFPASPSALHSSFGGLVPSANDALMVDDADEEERTSKPTIRSVDALQSVVSCTCFRGAGSGLRRRYIYERIACSDVLALIKFLFIVMSILGIFGALDCSMYVLLLWSFRYKDVYGGVTTTSAEVAT